MSPSLIRILAAALAAAASSEASAFLGVGDVSFVTVVANPAEAANWAAELERMSSEVAAAQATLQTVSDLRSFAGNPAAAVAALRDLQQIAGALQSLTSGSQTDADIMRAWQALGMADRLARASALLQSSGSGATMQVLGQTLPRDPSLYADLASQADAVSQIRGQVQSEQAARASLASELTLAWTRFRSASTESAKQAILAEISQLQSQNLVLDARRRALLDDVSLQDRATRAGSQARALAEDESQLAASSLLSADAAGRLQAAESQRLATLAKARAPAAQPDYSGIRRWTPADAGSPPP